MTQRIGDEKGSDDLGGVGVGVPASVDQVTAEFRGSGPSCQRSTDIHVRFALPSASAPGNLVLQVCEKASVCLTELNLALLCAFAQHVSGRDWILPRDGRITVSTVDHRATSFP